MSALVKPWTHTANTIDGLSDPINVEAVISVSTVDVEAANIQGGADSFVIVFHMAGANLNPKEVTWRYASDTLRDADLATLKTNNRNARSIPSAN